MSKLTTPTQVKQAESIILQCPKCLEIQEQRDVCIKCSLIFKKHYDAVHMKNSIQSGESTDDGIEIKKPLGPRNRSFGSFLNKSALIYFLAAALISIFNLGELEISKMYCAVFKALVPSLYGTSILSKEPNNTCLILALAWTMSIVTSGYLVKWLINKEFIVATPLREKFFFKLFGILLVTLLTAEIYLVPLSKSDTGFISKTTNMFVENWTVTSALWGMCIYSISLLMFMFVLTFLASIIDAFTPEK